LSVSACTRLYCLIGDPVQRSLSPFIMNSAFEQHGIDAVYAAFRVPASQLLQAVQGLRALGVPGANITYPHKEAVLPFIDLASARVEMLRAANTLHFSGGQISGHNTDAAGTAIALERFAGVVLKGKRVLVFGAGGAGRAAALGVLDAGAAAVTFCVRDVPKAEAVISSLTRGFADASISVVPMDDRTARDMRRTAVVESDILINATPIGMAGAHRTTHAQSDYDRPSSSTATDAARTASTASPLIEDPEWIGPGHCCFDFVYAPRETAFLRIARARGALPLGGLSLLVAQALESFRCWTRRTFDLDEMKRALESHAGG